MAKAPPIANRKRPCEECPWRLDAEPGQFPPERYRALTVTARDMTSQVFACHKSPPGQEHGCAGYLVQFRHNLSVRLRGLKHPVSSAAPLFATYRDMAIANGVDPDDPCLEGTR
jgi:hypothetical protein